MKKTDILILGAGCAGSSLAHYLEDFGYAGKVNLVDSRTDFSREQRWCSWGDLPLSLQPLVKESWQEWTVRDENQTISQTSDKFRYQQIHASDFYTHFHSHWQNSATPITLNLGEKVLRVVNQKDCVEVTTDKEFWQAEMVFDARHQGSPSFEKAQNSKSIYFEQTFVGWIIKSPRSVFDPKNATLMDFRTRQSDDVNFIYVLPYSENEALVESTSFSRNGSNRRTHLAALKEYISEHFGDDYEIKSEESGELPMTTAKFPTKISERIFAIGIAGGNARPSSGYAFQRIQRHTSKIARAIIDKKEFPQNFAPSKYDLFDKIFLEAIADSPRCGKDYFMKMFGKVSADSLIRFLLDESSLSDDLAMVAAMPKLKFGSLFLRSLWKNPATKNKSDERFQMPKVSLPNSVDSSAGRLVAGRIER